mmetsp:Transcript_8318/g.12463  ORF Transcript_8318/g.12463 Transcript_8318/m.12463 type:complete len:151 (-) Transcript_8318:721-1173(-)
MNSAQIYIECSRRGISLFPQDKISNLCLFLNMNPTDERFDLSVIFASKIKIYLECASAARNRAGSTIPIAICCLSLSDLLSIFCDPIALDLLFDKIKNESEVWIVHTRCAACSRASYEDIGITAILSLPSTGFLLISGQPCASLIYRLPK